MFSKGSVTQMAEESKQTPEEALARTHVLLGEIATLMDACRLHYRHEGDIPCALGMMLRKRVDEAIQTVQGAVNPFPF